MSSKISSQAEFKLFHFLQHLPDSPGVYRMMNLTGQIVYVGKAKNLNRRVKSYFQKTHSDPKTAQLVSQISSIEITLTRTEYEALVLESNLIKTHRPKYNIIFKDDKSYPFVWISPGDFPKIIPYRGRNTKTGELLGPFPDMTRLKESLSQLQKLFKFRQCDEGMFRHRSRPCLQYQIGRCSAPCVGYIDKTLYQQDIKAVTQVLLGKDDQVLKALEKKMHEYSEKLEFENASKIRDQIRDFQQLQSKQSVYSIKPSDVDVIALSEKEGLKVLMLLCVRDGKVLSTQSFWPKGEGSEESLLTVFFEQYYGLGLGSSSLPSCILTPFLLPWPEVLKEREGVPVPMIQVPRQGEKREWLKLAELNAEQAITLELTQKTRKDLQWTNLAEKLNLSIPLVRIECFDISHTQGHQTVASCVVFGPEGPLKKEYRRLNISGITPGDDYGALHQALMRRYQRVLSERKSLPSLVIIDGGPNQLKQAVDVWQQLGLPPEICLIGISKGEGRRAVFDRIHFFSPSEGISNVLELGADSQALHLIQRIRDEAHRFALEAHQRQRGESSLSLQLREIPGVGPKRASSLLRHFGGIQGLACASMEQLTQVPGISTALAEKVLQALNA